MEDPAPRKKSHFLAGLDEVSDDQESPSATGASWNVPRLIGVSKAVKNFRTGRSRKSIWRLSAHQMKTAQKKKFAGPPELLLDAGVISHYFAKRVRENRRNGESGTTSSRPTLGQIYQGFVQNKMSKNNSFATRCASTDDFGSEGSSSDTDSQNSSEEEEDAGKTEPAKASALAAQHRLLFAIQDEILKGWQTKNGCVRSNAFLTSVVDTGSRGSIRGSQLLDRFRAKVMELCQSLREGKLLNVEVDMVTLKYKIRPAGPARSLEEKAEIKDRDDRFWRLYHGDDGKKHHCVASESQQKKQKRRGRSALSATSSLEIKVVNDMPGERVAASMMATSSKFWTPAQNADLPDAKLVCGGHGRADGKAAKRLKKSSRLAQDGPDVEEDAGSLLVGMSTTRRLLQHRNIVRQRRIEDNKSCTLSNFPVSRSLPAGRDRKIGNDTRRGSLSNSRRSWQWVSPSATMAGTCSSWRSGVSDCGEDDESMAGTKSGFWDYGKFMDTRTRFRRRALTYDGKLRSTSQEAFKSRIASVKENLMETVSLPALRYGAQIGKQDPMEASGQRSRALRASEQEEMPRRGNDDKLPSLARGGKLGNSSSAPALTGTWAPSDKLPPVTRLPMAYDSTPAHAPFSRVAKASTMQLEPDSDVATMRYIRVCRAAGVVPTPSVLSMAATHKINGEELTDDGLCAFATMVRSLDYLESVDLAGNALLSDRALVPFLRKLFGRPASSSLMRLSLAGCKGAARGAVDTIVSLLSEPEGLFRLVEIDLSAIAILASTQLALCKAIAGHVQLRSVHLADTGLGLHPTAKLAVTSLLSAPRLEELDLGWNCFASEVFEALGHHVAEHNSLTKLHLASCAAVTARTESPVTWFLECLSRDRTLTALDVSLNRIDFRGALVLEDALEYHVKLSELSLGQNPLGVDGMRSFLRLLSRESSGLRHFECGQCDGENLAAEFVFNATDPTGGYVLNLKNPYHRSVLRMLYKACERFRLNPEKAFSELAYSPETSSGKSSRMVYRHPKEKDVHGVWCVPCSGILSAKFSMAEVLTTCFTDKSLSQTMTRSSWAPKRTSVQACGQAGVSALEGNTRPRISWLHHDHVVRDESTQPIASRFAERFLACVKYLPSIRKVVPLLAQWQSLKGQPREQQLLLDALSRDFLLTFGHIHQLCRVKSHTVQVLSKLLHCLEGGPVQLYMALTIPSHMDKFLKVQHANQQLFDFTAENPTAHYRLDLGNSASYKVGETLVLISRWEAAMRKKSGCLDMSQHGNWSNFRNVMHANQELSLADFPLPTHGTIHFDFVSWRRPPLCIDVVADDCWERLMIMLTVSECKAEAKHKALRMVSDQFFLKALQLRELLSAFHDANHHVEVVCMFLLRLKDVQNAKVVHARLTGTGEWKMLRQRMGILSVFPYFQPEQWQFDADLSVYEDRMAVALTFGLAVRENLDNMRQLSLNNMPFTKGAPPQWEKFEEVPSAGIFHCKYVCTPLFRKMAVRGDFAFKYGGFSFADGDKNIMWWSHLLEAPDPVLFFLYYCMRHFKDMHTPFRIISGGKEAISLSVLKKQMAAWGWRKFKKHPDWVTLVFRYLDPDGDGEVSVQEWDAFVQLFKELQLTILEFLQYLNRTFVGNFDLAWHEIDADGSDSVDFEEWGQAMNYIGFYGTGDPIFYYLADEKEDVIKEEGWMRIKEKWRDRHELQQKIAHGTS